MTGDELRAIRTSAGMTQAAFAARLGISARQLLNLESGRANIRANLATLALALQSTTDTDRPYTNGILIF